MKAYKLLIILLITNSFINTLKSANFQASKGGTCTISIGSNGVTDICQGDSILLEASSGFISYAWSTGENSRLIWILKSGKYVVEAIDANSCIARDSIEITIFPKQELKIFSNPNPPLVCTGKAVVLEASGGFANYWWSNGNRTNRTVVEPKESKTYVVEAVDSNGCDARAVIEIKVQSSNELKIYSNPNPPIICAGKAIVLEASGGFANYWWSNGNRTNRTVVEPKESRTYVVEAVDSNGCDARTVIEIKVLEIPELKIFSSPSPPVICLGDSIILEASSGFSKYWWSIGGRTKSIVISPSKSTTFVLEAETSNGCGGRAKIEVEVDSCNTSLMGLDQEKSINIYPNPSLGKVNISLINIDKEGAIIEILDANNNIIYHKKVQNVTTVLEQIELSNFKKGIYFLKVETDGKVKSKKFIVN